MQPCSTCLLVLLLLLLKVRLRVCVSATAILTRRFSLSRAVNKRKAVVVSHTHFNTLLNLSRRVKLNGCAESTLWIP